MVQPPSNAISDRALIDAYAGGMSLRAISARTGLSHETVRKRLVVEGVRFRSSAETAALLRRLRLEEHGSRIRETFLRTLDVRRTANECGVSSADVRAHLANSSVLHDYEGLTGRPRKRERNYTDADLVASLQEAAANASTSPLTVSAYIDYHRSSPMLADGRPRPGHQTMMRVGPWGDALRRAGLPANPPGGPLSPNDPVKALLSLVACWDDIGSPPIVDDYDKWQRGKKDHPGSKTARELLGSWPLALIRAWQIRYGIELDQSDTEIAIPPSLVAPATALFADYTPADEDVLLQQRKFELQSGIDGLNESVKNHRRLQNRLAEALRNRGVVPRSPTEVPMFDLAFSHSDGSVVVFEVKSANSLNFEAQLRLGLGQVLRYAHQLGARHDRVQPALLIQLEPSDDWKSLLDELGVALLFESDLAAGVNALLAGS